MGHTGTLDPLATGVLVLCIGRATRLSQFLSDHDKVYRTRIRLGVTTDTLDAEGRVVAESEEIPQEFEQVAGVVGKFVGKIAQRPPMYSALKVSGKRLHELARAGKQVDRQARWVQVYRIEITEFSPPVLNLLVSCSKGTYIRSLADDIGRKLGCGGHVSELRRTVVGTIGLDRCVDLEHLESTAREGDARRHLLDPNQGLTPMPAVTLSGIHIDRFTHGNSIDGLPGPGGVAADDRVRAVDSDGALLGIGRWSATGELQPVRVYRSPDDRAAS